MAIDSRACHTRFTPPYMEKGMLARQEEEGHEILHFRNLRAMEVKVGTMSSFPERLALVAHDSLVHCW
jgi:hypothetical protein